MPLQSAYYPNYFSIDDILATQERTPCKFLHNVPKLGRLNAAADDADVQSGIELELPIWLATEISSGNQPVTTAELPKVYKESYREILTADPTAVDLHKFGLYFYELGSHVKNWDRRGDVAEILIYTFKMRFRQLMDLADNMISDPNILNRLDVLEKSLYKSGHNARSKLNDWLKNSEFSLQAADMVINHKKRKRVDVEDIL